ncbi:MAG: CHAD domain-containing protein [Actinomycetota bacterium]|nr:CHAD domain-containing protein [Actinomycetota bacterium]
MKSTDLLPPVGLTPEEAVQELQDALTLGRGEVHESERRYFDTFDGRVRAAGLLVRHEPAAGGQSPGRLSLLDGETGAERAVATSAAPAGPLQVLPLPPGPLGDRLAGILGERALILLARIDTRVHAFGVLDAEGKTVVRLALQEPMLVSASGWRRPLRQRLSLVPVRGYEREGPRVTATLEPLGFTAAERPLVDEAVIAGGGTPGGVSAKIEVKLAPSQRADAAAAAVLRRLAEVIEANLEGTIADLDAEFLHDFRVSVRRSRAVQREFRGTFPAETLERFRSEFRWLQLITGVSRDLDVYVLEFEAMRALVPGPIRSDLDPLGKVLLDRRLVARRTMARALRSERATTLRRDWEAFLEELVGLPDDGRPDAGRAIGQLVGERIAKVYRKMVKLGSAIDADTPPEAYHDLRKKGKELRYLLELFGAALFPGDVVKPMIKTLKALQDVLGRHQDREVQVATLHELSEEVSARPGGAAALMAMGVLVQRLQEEERTARDEFAEHFAGFSAKAQRRLVKETFA